MNAQTLQLNLRREGYDPGPIDGVNGARTIAAFLGFVAGRQPDDMIRAIAAACVARWPNYGVTTALRICHFTAQAAHESNGFRNMREIWGPTEAQKGYEGRQDLGNVKPGDGSLFRGRGIFEITGRANYATYGLRAGLSLVAQPELAEDPVNAVLLACLYWDAKALNAWADADNLARITKLINGGANGLALRKDKLARAKSAWGIS